MQILCLGLSHHTAPVEVRERLQYSPDALRATLARCGCGREAHPPSISELVILSTCNRLELYAAVSGAQGSAEERAESALFAPLLSFIAETRSMPVAEFETHLYQHEGPEAVEHLCRVAAGLDSMILGEPQILGQVTEAYQEALGQGAVGPVLSALFRTAIRVGKRVRTETAISRNPSTVGSVAVKLAGAVVGDLASARVLILGAGEMAELAVEALRTRGAGHISVVSRTRDRATQLAQRWGAQALTFEQLAEALAAADIVIASTAAPHVLVTPDLARAAIARRPERPLIFIDIAVPRNVDPDVSRLPNVHCYDIDDLQSRLNGALAEREREIPRVEAIVAEEASAFTEWLRGLDIAALIAELRVRADALRRAEVEKTLRRLPHLDETERQRIEALAESLVNKLLHAPTLRLKAEAGNGHAAEYAAAARYLFALDP
jgi:glutamyl-tRNA reductase